MQVLVDLYVRIRSMQVYTPWEECIMDTTSAWFYALWNGMSDKDNITGLPPNKYNGPQHAILCENCRLRTISSDSSNFLNWTEETHQEFPPSKQQWQLLDSVFWLSEWSPDENYQDCMVFSALVIQIITIDYWIPTPRQTHYSCAHSLSQSLSTKGPDLRLEGLRSTRSIPQYWEPYVLLITEKKQQRTSWEKVL
jgi:hypothetical protein